MPKLYLITPPAIEIDEFVEIFLPLAPNPLISHLQLRLKETSDAKIIAAANSLLPICQANNIKLIMNDRPDLCATTNCHGVHLGQTDATIKAARQIIGSDKIIGSTCHADLSLASQAAKEGADYVAFGAFYPSKTKPNATPAPPEILAQWQSTNSQIPCVAIGGISPKNASALLAADYLAVSNSVWQDPLTTLAAFAKIM